MSEKLIKPWLLVRLRAGGCTIYTIVAPLLLVPIVTVAPLAPLKPVGLQFWCLVLTTSLPPCQKFLKYLLIPTTVEQ